MEQLRIIRTLKELKELEEYLSDKEFISVDTETTGVDHDSEVIGFSVAAEIDVGYYVILSYWDVKQQKLIYLETKGGAKAALQTLKGKSLIMHNAGFDCGMIDSNFGVQLIEDVHTDTMELAHLLDENRRVGLKELAVSIFGEDSRTEQLEMKESVYKNGGVLTKEKYELYKADADLMARYGAKDTILTLKLFYHLVPELYEQGLDKFFYEDESMPLLRGPTYQLNHTGLKVDQEALNKLKATLMAELAEAKTYIHSEIKPHVKDKYKGTSPGTTFNIGASKQLSWLLFIRLGNEFNGLTKGGRELCKALDIKVPYAPGAKREFLKILGENKGKVYSPAKFNPKTGKMGRPKKVGDAWNYLSCGKDSLGRYATKYKWVNTLLAYNKNLKLLNTYVEGIQSRLKYGIIHPSFLQHGTTSGRYSSKAPNFQNLPKNDKRIKACIVARPGKIFVGADQSQLEPRVFASTSQDPTLLACFAKGEDFYSVVGAPIFEKEGCSLYKKGADSFAELYPGLRDISKAFALATPYGTSAFQQSSKLGLHQEECQQIIDRYFAKYPKVEMMMLESHEQAKKTGVVYNLFGRPRRIPAAMDIPKIYGKSQHSDLPYAARTLLNLAMNHRVQSTGASIMNRAAIAFYRACKDLEESDPRWKDVKVVLQVHDELNAECPIDLAPEVKIVLKYCMESTTELPGVALIAEPTSAYNLADLK